MWSVIIDGILIVLILVGAVIGIVKGLIDSVISLVGSTLAFGLAVWLAKYCSNFINKIVNIEQFFLDKLDASNEGTVEFFGGKFSYTNVEVAKFAVWIITVIILFLIFKLAILILARIFESVTQSSPTLTGINRVLGMIFGAIKGCVHVVVILALCSAMSQVPVIGETINNKIAETKVTSFAYKYVDDFVENQLTKEKIDDIIEKIVSNNTPSGDTTES